ncbi:DMT family transporter [Sporosarcina sp. FSL W7-1349]|uniref:DMT family transporter n=1 Tax=Sporosarcina sp. FSL W7-1349 TaxID=2921561 RepID=UPI0030F618F6
MSKIFSKTTIALLLLIFFWGASWSVYKMALPYTPPLLFAGMRALIGGLLLAAFVFAKRSEIQWRRHWKKYVISAIFNSILFFGLQTVGLIYLPGGLFSVLVYFQPVLLGIFAWLWLGEYMAPVKILGLFVGFIGIIIVSLDGLHVHISVIGVVLGLLTALCWALGTVYVKKVSREINAFWMVAMQSIIGGSVLLGVGSITESWSAIEWNIPVLVGIGYGATFGIPISYVIYYTLVNAGEASKVGSFTFLVPIIAVFIGTVFFGEPLTFTLLIGLALVGLSIYFVNYNGRPRELPVHKENV